MFTYESVKNFVEQRLDLANKNPKNALTMEAQAFGCLSFVQNQCWQTQPELESRLIQMWNEEWKPLFWQLYREG